MPDPGTRSSLRPPTSQVATFEQLQGSDAAFWLDELRTPSRRRDRKSWELVWLMQALSWLGLVAPGRRGLGFAVGREPVAAYLASRGVHVLATDAPPGAAGDQWAQTGQYAAHVGDLDPQGLCAPERARAHLRFRHVDMNAIDPDLEGFDFCWSLCAVEHLGDLPRMQRFLHASLDTLKPGGWSLHTAELWLQTPGQHPPSSGETIFPDRAAWEAVALSLTQRGHHVAPFDWHLGSHPSDAVIDKPPYTRTHLKLRYMGVDTTSMGILIRRAH